MSTMEIVELSIAQQRRLWLIAIGDGMHASPTSKELLEVQLHKCFLWRAQCSQHDAQSRPSYPRLQTWTILRPRTARLPGCRTRMLSRPVFGSGPCAAAFFQSASADNAVYSYAG